MSHRSAAGFINLPVSPSPTLTTRWALLSLSEATGEDGYLKTAVHYLEELKKSRCAGFQEYCWGYPFDWVTRNGTIKAETPFITSTPYVWEAFLQDYELGGQSQRSEVEIRGQRSETNRRSEIGDQRSEVDQHTAGDRCKLTSDLRLLSTDQTPPSPDYRQILESIARHATNDIKDFTNLGDGQQLLLIAH